jgi:hypothetical protein
VLAFCDHFCLLCGGQLKHKVFGKSIPVPFDLFVQPFGRIALELCEVGIQHYPFSADQQDGL